MTSSMLAGIVVFVVVGLASVNAQNVTCYACSSALNSWCGDPFSASSANAAAGSTCTGTSCTKYSASVSGVASVVTRSCSYGGSNGCQSAGVSGVASSTTCICSGNLCNSATAAMSSIVTTIVAAAGVVLYVATRRLH